MNVKKENSFNFLEIQQTINRGTRFIVCCISKKLNEECFNIRKIKLIFININIKLFININIKLFININIKLFINTL